MITEMADLEHSRMTTDQRITQISTLPKAKYRLAEWLATCGLNVFFLSALLRTFGRATFTLESLNIIACGCLLVSASILYKETAGMHAYRRWMITYAFVFVLMLVQSLQQLDPTVFTLELMPFLIVFIWPIGACDKIWRRLNRIFVWHLLIGSAVALYLVATTYMPTREAFFDSDFFWTRHLVYAFPLIFMQFIVQRRLGRIAALAGLLSVGAWAIYGQNRGMVINQLGFYMIAAVWIWQVTARKHSMRRFAVIAAVVVAGLLIFNSEWASNMNGSHQLESLEERFVADGGILETFAGDPRWFEAGLFVRQLSFLDMALGRGITGSWSDQHWMFEETRYMVHLGFLHFILKGGIPLLLLFLYFPMLTGWRALLKSRNILTMAAAGVCVQYIFKCFNAGAMDAELSFVLLMLCAGRCASALSSKNAA